MHVYLLIAKSMLCLKKEKRNDGTPMTCRNVLRMGYVMIRGKGILSRNIESTLIDERKRRRIETGNQNTKTSNQPYSQENTK